LPAIDLEAPEQQRPDEGAPQLEVGAGDERRKDVVADAD
jgi:hypothetical protein